VCFAIFLTKVPCLLKIPALQGDYRYHCNLKYRVSGEARPSRTVTLTVGKVLWRRRWMKTCHGRNMGRRCLAGHACSYSYRSLMQVNATLCCSGGERSRAWEGGFGAWFLPRDLEDTERYRYSKGIR